MVRKPRQRTPRLPNARATAAMPCPLRVTPETYEGHPAGHNVSLGRHTVIGEVRGHRLDDEVHKGLGGIEEEFLL